MKNKMRNNPLSLNSKYILSFVMIYAAVSVTADVVAFKFTNFLGLVESGATIIFPITYIIGDVVCEVYGWNTAMKMVWLGLVCEALFAILITVIINMQSYGIGVYQNEYNDILGNIWLFVFAGVVSNAIAGLLNIFFISKWKILSKGKVFWMRSILSTCISELLLIFITVIIAFLPIIHMKATLKVFIDAYFLEIIYAIIFVIPAQFLVYYLKQSEGIDAYDYGISYNPFKFVH